jgi:L-rhamnose mutarotase
MTRHAFVMRLKPGFEAEYKRRHDEIWPELVRELESAGVSDYSIYLDSGTSTLFAVQKLKDHNASDDLASTEVVKRWWRRMSDIMETNPDHSPVTIPLTEVFHMD